MITVAIGSKSIGFSLTKLQGSYGDELAVSFTSNGLQAEVVCDLDLDEGRLATFFAEMEAPLFQESCRLIQNAHNRASK